MPVLFAPILTRFAAEILEAAGAPADKAGITAESLIASNLRGVDSHGLQLLPFYIEQILAGEMDPKADGAVVSESGSCLVFDAQNALGQWVAETCCGHAGRLAGTHGAGVVVAFCNASPIVPPWQGREGRIGTNPICMSVPGPWLLDMATTTVAAGKIFKAFINDKPEIPAGWAFDSRGVPTTDTKAAYNKGMLMPLGGYKGSGLGRHNRCSQCFIAIDIARFMPVEEFTARVEQLVHLMKTTPTAPGYDEVQVAGDPEWRTEAERRRNGIPIEDGNWDLLVKTATRLGVAVPTAP